MGRRRSQLPKSAGRTLAQLIPGGRIRKIDIVLVGVLSMAEHKEFDSNALFNKVLTKGENDAARGTPRDVRRYAVSGLTGSPGLPNYA